MKYLQWILVVSVVVFISVSEGARERDCEFSPDGGRWRKECNWCHCTENGVGACTRRGCPPGLAHRLRDEIECEGKAKWKIDCNWCFCDNGRAACTEKFCGERREVDCEFSPDGGRWRKECNWCHCSENGVGACTRRGCPPGLAFRLRDEIECEGNAKWKDDCNWCTCDNGRAKCTEKLCGVGAEKNFESKTQENDCIFSSRGGRWRKSCNWCRCTETGKGLCTRRGCPPSLAIRLQNEKECEGDAQWRNDCNWCKCTDGNAICTQKFCGNVDSRNTEGRQANEECRFTSIDSRWRQSCNWCRCTENGLSVCTRMGCPPDFELRLQNADECEGKAEWKRGCNWCNCDKGKAVCTTSPCDQQNAGIAQEKVDSDTQSPSRNEIRCEALSRDSSWREDCNWCTCSTLGYGQCTRMMCPESSSLQKSDDKGDCKGLIRWKRGCNWCECVDGVAVCSGKSCLKDSSTSDIDEVCQTGEGGGRWRIDCNWCVCQKGIGTCTLRGCNQDFNENILRDTPACEGDITWRKDCNWCRCVKGQPVCTDYLCRSHQRSLAEEETCAEGQSWVDGCNSCFCANGRSFCTRMACVEDRQHAKTTVLRTRAREVSALASSGEFESRDCTEGSSWKDNCNWCSCSNGFAACTLMACPTHLNPPKLGEGPVCEEGSSWRQDCNYCSCAGGHPVCTLIACLPNEPRTKSVHKQEQASEFSSPSPLECKHGSRWKNACNWCFCSHGAAACTLMGCLPGYRDDEGDVCEGDSEWRGENCSWCKCHQGSAVCEPTTDCDEEKKSDCKEGNTWMEECNFCSCINNMKVCTRKLCENDSEIPQPTCTEGESWEDDCNTCRCYEGQPACTLNICEDHIKPHVVPETCKFSPVQSSSQCTSNIEVKWTYNAQTGRCETIEDGGCGGTEGRFSTRDECENICLHTRARQVPFTTPLNSRERCYLPSDSGPCFGLFTRYYFNAQKNRCESFHYGGCQGNENNFETIQECYGSCAGNPPSIDPNCDRSQCNWKRLDHYLSQSCTPIYEGGSCCPTKFNCKSELERGLEPDKCYYKGKKYNLREDVPVEDSCSASCFCSKTGIACANVECPSLWIPPEAGCRLLYTPGYCCSTGKECGPSDSRSEEYCTWKGQQWKIGDRMDFKDEPCQDCVCTSDFTDPKGPGCSKHDCGYEFRYRRRLTEGCVPIFFEDSCCPIDWLCPDDTRIREVISPLSSTESGQNVCTLGQHSVPLGSSLETSECSIDCICQTPPQLTCVKQRSCEGLFLSDLELKTEKDCPETFCPPLCSIENDPSTTCPKCVCPNLNFTCKEPSCDSSCLNPTVVFDEVAGCSVCRCNDHLCPKDIDGEPPCPQDCAVLKVFNKETGCEECVCQENTSHPF